MQCENQYCIYWQDDSCLLNEVSLDVRGCCQSCIYATIPESLLKNSRESLLALYEQADNLCP